MHSEFQGQDQGCWSSDKFAFCFFKDTEALMLTGSSEKDAFRLPQLKSVSEISWFQNKRLHLLKRLACEVYLIFIYFIPVKLNFFEL